MDMTKIKSKSSINCMHGIRSLSVLWVVLGHRRFFHLFYPMTNPNEEHLWLQNVRTVIFQTDHLAVDTFFVMGGLLLTVSFLNDLDKKRVSLWRMYLKRYLRYTPVLAVLILFQISLMKYTVYGPNFNFEGNARNCMNNWWAAFLHIQNYLDFTQMVGSPVVV
jgi:peptidoglycan/LPS O-acetylase OafA/YrhL